MTNAWAQNQVTFIPIGKWPEHPLLATPMSTKVVPPEAYVAGVAHPPAPGHETATLRLLTLDVSTPSQPRYLGHFGAATDSEWWLHSSTQVQGDFVHVVA